MRLAIFAAGVLTGIAYELVLRIGRWRQGVLWHLIPRPIRDWWADEWIRRLPDPVDPLPIDPYLENMR